MEEMQQRVDEAIKSGEMFATGGLVPAGVRILATDGPYAEAKEMVAGLRSLSYRPGKRRLNLRRTFCDLQRWRVRDSTNCGRGRDSPSKDRRGIVFRVGHFACRFHLAPFDV
jgi:hypothetical protein